jgi:ribonuclease HI
MFYAVAAGHNVGVFSNWTDCKQSVQGYRNAVFKKFDDAEDANRFVQNHILTNTSTDDFHPDYYVYTDGSCSKNGTRDAIAGIGIYFGQNDPRNVSTPLVGKQTNNAAELTAIIRAIGLIRKDLEMGKRVCIATDSEYSIKCATSYGEKCSRNTWKIDIPNKVLVQELYESYNRLPNCKLVYVKAHTNESDIHSIGNREADRLACEASVR